MRSILSRRWRKEWRRTTRHEKVKAPVPGAWAGTRTRRLGQLNSRRQHPRAPVGQAGLTGASVAPQNQSFGRATHPPLNKQPEKSSQEHATCNSGGSLSRHRLEDPKSAVLQGLQPRRPLPPPVRGRRSLKHEAGLARVAQLQQHVVLQSHLPAQKYGEQYVRCVH